MNLLRDDHVGGLGSWLSARRRPAPVGSPSPALASAPAGV